MVSVNVLSLSFLPVTLGFPIMVVAGVQDWRTRMVSADLLIAGIILTSMIQLFIGNEFFAAIGLTLGLIFTFIVLINATDLIDLEEWGYPLGDALAITFLACCFGFWLKPFIAVFVAAVLASFAGYWLFNGIERDCVPFVSFLALTFPVGVIFFA